MAAIIMLLLPAVYGFSFDDQVSVSFRKSQDDVLFTGRCKNYSKESEGKDSPVACAAKCVFLGADKYSFRETTGVCLCPNGDCEKVKDPSWTTYAVQEQYDDQTGPFLVASDTTCQGIGTRIGEQVDSVEECAELVGQMCISSQSFVYRTNGACYCANSCDSTSSSPGASIYSTDRTALQCAAKGRSGSNENHNVDIYLNQLGAEICNSKPATELEQACDEKDYQAVLDLTMKSQRTQGLVALEDRRRRRRLQEDEVPVDMPGDTPSYPAEYLDSLERIDALCAEFDVGLASQSSGEFIEYLICVCDPDNTELNGCAKKELQFVDVLQNGIVDALATLEADGILGDNQEGQLTAVEFEQLLTLIRAGAGADYSADKQASNISEAGRRLASKIEYGYNQNPVTGAHEFNVGVCMLSWNPNSLSSLTTVKGSCEIYKVVEISITLAFGLHLDQPPVISAQIAICVPVLSDVLDTAAGMIPGGKDFLKNTFHIEGGCLILAKASYDIPHHHLSVQVNIGKKWLLNFYLDITGHLEASFSSSFTGYLMNEKDYPSDVLSVHTRDDPGQSNPTCAETEAIMYAKYYADGWNPPSFYIYAAEMIEKGTKCALYGHTRPHMYASTRIRVGMVLPPYLHCWGPWYAIECQWKENEINIVDERPYFTFALDGSNDMQVTNLG